jgi:diguanylate cyclase (GGDEF)-like protein
MRARRCPLLNYVASLFVCSGPPFVAQGQQVQPAPVATRCDASRRLPSIEELETTAGISVALGPPTYFNGMGSSGTVNQAEPLSVQDANVERTQQIRAELRDVGRRQWWLWSSAVMVTILLTLGIASFAFPGLLDQPEPYYSFELSQAVRGLVGLVLLFNVYTIYQHLQIRRMQEALAGQVFAMDKMEARTEEVYKLALLDSLTGLYNRRCGEQRLATEVARTQRNGLPLTIIMLDLNGLKYVNDKYGHPAGDEMLKYFASRLNKAIRGSDLAVRLGGDEFLLLLPECKPEEVRHVLGRLSGTTIELGGQTLRVTFAAGWTNYIPGETPEELLKRADEALYVNKRAVKQEELSLTIQ